MDKKILITLLLLIFPAFVSSQVNEGIKIYGYEINTGNLGKDNCCFLNEDESKFLNILFSHKRDSFDFSGRRCFFLGGAGGGLIKEKRYFFKTANLYNSSWEKGCQLIILNEQESSDYGYDAVIVIWSKRIISKKYALKKIRKYLAKSK